jgi:hypothetical protein
MVQDLAANSQPGILIDHAAALPDNSAIDHMESIALNRHVGRVLLPESLDVDPGFMSFQFEGYSSQNLLPNADGVRLWSKYFALVSSSNGITIPSSWSSFFTKALLSSDSFGWANTFLESKAWEIIIKDKASCEVFSFSIPQKCHSKDHLLCLAPMCILSDVVLQESSA